ncbi:MAG TPA: hypothetical protein VK957_12265 [Lunatimonas sp.]|nr:hypothetical protein [Lunatimonas sp.]
MRTNDVATSTVWNIRGEMCAFKIHEMPNELIAINSNFEDISAFEPSSFIIVQNSLSFKELFRSWYIETDVEFPYYEEVKIGLSIQ